ncbi:hypothetical protein GP486_001799 [Trichoglossum hirsutum]|uniref:CID domain-containing protein n=1 Tax=Trichoglossum hirsutum TaxID=265104 RepID=A0A9P8RSA7_9PEZI|nr:hypothetical protein GP486_001799 [Trichoglossum hirsutum]
MSSGLASDEVAEDYKNSLEDLTFNSRWEISNLTVIAKENMDHALAISRAIENHIKSTAPNRKLPALYLLDSVAKNVGTPYTLFFGRNLYQTFMSAYSLVDGSVRRKLEEMLKTWKEPVPGSMSSKPVFPTEVTRSIDNALIKARTAAVQMQQQQARNDPLGRGRGITPTQTPPIPFRSTPTPPVAGTRYPPPQTTQPYVSQPNGNSITGIYGGSQPLNHQAYTNSSSVTNYQQPDGFAQSAGSIDSLHNDIANLIATTRTEFATNPYDEGIRQRLKALLDLQSILQSQQLPPDQLKLIKDQVAQLTPASVIPAPVSTPIPPQTQPPPQLTPASFISAPISTSIPPQAQPSQQQQQQQQQSSLQTMFPPNALAALLASTATTQQPTPPPVQLALPVTQTPIPYTQSPPVPTQGIASSENSLLASLRAAGMLPAPSSNSVPPPPPPSLPAAPLPTNHPFQIPFSLPHISTPPNVHANPAQPSQGRVPNDVQMTSASLKISRPHLISLLYEGQPNQCASCGRRFLSTDEGKKKKAAHLDWHFKVNQRMAEAVKRGQNRSWYVDEMEWIKSRDDPDDLSAQPANGPLANPGTTATSSGSAMKKDPKLQFIPVPNDAALANVNCPICQEKFETVWHDQAQEWVWMDAVKIGGKVYHASCHAEASKDGAGILRGATPERVLGKRKAEDNDAGLSKTKVKKELLA